jgi:hypothetical protein
MAREPEMCAHGKRYDALIAAARAELGTQAGLVCPLGTQS